MQVLAQPEPLQRFHPAGHDQAVGVLVARCIVVGVVGPVGKPVSREKCANQVACHQNPSHFSRTHPQSECHAPSHSERDLCQVNAAVFQARGLPVIAKQKRDLNPQKLKATGHE